MLTDHRCTKYTDCSSCGFYQRDIFKYRLYPKGYVIPQTRCMQNMVFFLIKGEIWLNSEEHPDTTFRGGQFEYIIFNDFFKTSQLLQLFGQK